MARKLPWERLAGSARPSPRPRPSASASRRSFSPAPTAGPSNRDDDANRGRPPKRQRPDTTARYRTPSTSPPPAPPTESFMIDGMQHDDRHRMVEDELLAVAHTFTAHLHAAEYQRLRAKAKSQTVAALRSLVRPVTTSVQTERVARKAAAAQQAAKQKAAMRAFGEERDGRDDKDKEDSRPWTGTALQDLMESDPHKGRPSLVSLASLTGGRGASQTTSRPTTSRPTTKRAAPIVQEDDDEDDEDDLDGPSLKSRPSVTTNFPALSRPRAAAKATRIPTKDGPPEKRTVSFAPKAREITVSRYQEDDTVANNDAAEGEDDNDEEDDAGDLLKQVRKRRALQKAERQQQQKRRQDARTREQSNKPESLDTIPSFL